MGGTLSRHRQRIEYLEGRGALAVRVVCRLVERHLRGLGLCRPAKRAAWRIIADQAAQLAAVLDAMTGQPHTEYEMMLVAGAFNRLDEARHYFHGSTAARLVASGWQLASADEYRAAVATRGPITDDDRRIVRSTATVGEAFTCYGGMSNDVTYENGPDPRILSFGRHGDVPPDEQDNSDVGGQDPVSV